MTVSWPNRALVASMTPSIHLRFALNSKFRFGFLTKWLVEISPCASAKKLCNDVVSGRVKMVVERGWRWAEVAEPSSHRLAHIRCRLALSCLGALCSHVAPWTWGAQV